MTPTLIIDSPAVIDALYDPLRRRIVRHLANPMSVKQLAADLGTSVSKLYYHVHLLEQHGLIEIADTRISGKRLERLYVSTYDSFRLDPSLKGSPVASSNGMVIGMLEDAVDELAIGMASCGDDADVVIVMTNHRKRLSKERASEFVQRQHALVEEYFGEAVLEDADGQLHGSLTVVAPLPEG